MMSYFLFLFDYEQKRDIFVEAENVELRTLRSVKKNKKWFDNRNTNDVTWRKHEYNLLQEWKYGKKTVKLYSLILTQRRNQKKLT